MKNKLLPLYLTNFLLVFDDNLLKSLICFISVYWVPDAYKSVVMSLATGFLVLPFILFSPYAGYLSKKLNKRQFVVYLKTAEILTTLIAITGFWTENIYLVFLGIFLIGLQGTFFSPLKFALVRDIGGEEKSSIGTGTVEMTTFYGVLIGTAAAGLLTDIDLRYRMLWIGAAFIMVSVSGLITALQIRASEPKALTLHIAPLNFINYIIRKYKWANNHVKGLNNIVLGLSLFWLVASLIQLNLYVHCIDYLGISSTKTGVILALVAIAIGTGSFVSGLIAKEHVEVGLIPLGGTLFIGSIMAIFIFNPKGIAFVALIMLAALTAGLFKTPMNAWMQVHVKGRKLGDAVAYNNLINFIFILISAGIFGITESLYGSRAVFLVVGLLSVLMIVLLTINTKGIKESIHRLLKI
ncbi:MAG: Lysophospholipid transporter LplT [Bacteroidetes bacterium ADurb.Bin408]|nr:MAG: Lysophospholipid transporter LplT [Bacteroidetes bacterium ADurb.Bin408]